jgi:hypothetical protein
MIKVYVSGPLTTGTYTETCFNVRKAIDMAEQLFSLGYAPFCPHLTHYWHLHHAHTWSEWMAFDRVWVEACNVLYRLPGVSKGADQEVEWALAADKPVVTTIEGLRMVTNILGTQD